MRLIIIALVAVSAIIGCSKDYSDLPQISVDFVWLKDQSCFDTRSPEIKLSNVPADTKYLKIKLFDLDNRYHHGGGRVEYTSLNVISEGALKDYKGPCPNYGAPRYELSVKAIGADDKIIGFGKKVKRYPPDKNE